MFTNATILELYARARRDDDLRGLRQPSFRRTGIGLGDLLRRLLPRRAPAIQPAPVRTR